MLPAGVAPSINWFTSGLSLGQRPCRRTLDTNRQIKVFCGGGGSTDFLIDVLGYYICSRAPRPLTGWTISGR